MNQLFIPGTITVKSLHHKIIHKIKKRRKSRTKQIATVSKYDMKKEIQLVDFPFEIQEKILDLLNEKDHVSMHRVSKSWKQMISDYLNEKNTIHPRDWKWFCRHDPKIKHCHRCLNKCRTKNDQRGLATDWNWWL